MVKFQRDVIFVEDCANILSNLVTEMCKKVEQLFLIGEVSSFFHVFGCSFFSHTLLVFSDFSFKRKPGGGDSSEKIALKKVIPTPTPILTPIPSPPTRNKYSSGGSNM